MRTRTLLAATSALLAVTALTGCSDLSGAVKTASTPAPAAAVKPDVQDGRFNTPEHADADGHYMSSTWVKLPDGSRVLCVFGGNYNSMSCDWVSHNQ